MISHTLDSDREVSGSAKKHINRCSDCRRFYEISLALADQLRQEAVLAQREDFSQTRERILSAVDQSSNQNRTRVRRFRPAVIAAAAAVIMVLGGVVLVIQQYHTPVGKTQPIRPDTPVSLSLDSSAVLAMLGSNITEDNIKQTWPVVLEKPINQEIDNLVAQATSAVEFLMACASVDFAEVEAN